MNVLPNPRAKERASEKVEVALVVLVDRRKASGREEKTRARKEEEKEASKAAARQAIGYVSTATNPVTSQPTAGRHSSAIRHTESKKRLKKR